ncbi:MAG: putative DNA modification/repair radical SAM protein [Oscillospiraceae bacterium]|nr:putative DNA modification/repair radical SAM protein [Oscillospiraceae bacterium]
MNTEEKLKILADAAKYDVSCSSGGVRRSGRKGFMGNASSAGCCHSFTADGRCISLLKVLMTNVCAYDCAYCINRRSSDVPRAAFTPRELAELTMQFYRRNYIEGLFLSSAVMRSPDHTTEQLISALRLLREEYGFRGYIHAKAIPGTDPLLIEKLGTLADRLSVNIELPSEQSLKLLAPDKTKEGIFGSMKLISDGIKENGEDLVKYRSAPGFARAGQSTQMIVGATPESDRKILGLAEGLYKKYGLKRVFYSAYVPVAEGRGLPSADTAPPLMREHRLYQADWLLRFYGFSAEEILDEEHPNFNTLIDPKCSWALGHMDRFPVEVNRADYEMLLRVPGIGVKGARRIIAARRASSVDFEDLKKLGVTLKRAKYFITCRGRPLPGLDMRPEVIAGELMSEKAYAGRELKRTEQLSLFDAEEYEKCLTGQL